MKFLQKESTLVFLSSFTITSPSTISLFCQFLNVSVRPAGLLRRLRRPDGGLSAEPRERQTGHAVRRGAATHADSEDAHGRAKGFGKSSQFKQWWSLAE